MKVTRLASFILLSAALPLAMTTGCGSKGGGSSRSASTVAPIITTMPAPIGTGTAPITTATPPVAVQPATETVPVILVHGHGSEPETFEPFLDRFGAGRAKVKALYAAEADKLNAGDLPPACVVAAGYYRESATSQLYDPDKNGRGQGSIGGCPVPRQDGKASRYPISYAARLGRIIDGVRRATGSDRVDLVLHSMGNLVGRAYTKWLSDGAAGGKSKIRKILCVAGPHRGINALEATIDGLENDGQREFMRMGECAEMCNEYRVYQGQSFVEHLNDGWDAFCQAKDVHYAGFSAGNVWGTQVDPNASTAPPKKLFGLIKLTGSLKHVWDAVNNLSLPAAIDVWPLVTIWAPNSISEYADAMGESDGTVRLVSSRMDYAPFGASEFWMQVEARHGSSYNPEQAAHCSTFAAELANQFFAGRVKKGGAVAKLDLVAKDAPGKATWLELDTTIVGGSVSAQLIEENLDASGKPTGAATGYGVVLNEGDQRAYVAIPAGAGDRRYRVVAYGADGKLVVKNDIRVKAMAGAVDDLPKTTLVGATPALTGQGPVVSATFASNTQANDPTLEFSFRLDGGAWTSYSSLATFDTPPLAAGEHRLEARSRHSRNGAAALVEDAKGLAVGLHVDAGGAVTVRK